MSTLFGAGYVLTIESTALVAGFWRSLPLDYMLRITRKERSSMLQMPSAMPTSLLDHPLALALLLRTLRLNCLTSAYARSVGGPLRRHLAVGRLGMSLARLSRAGRMIGTWEGHATPLAHRARTPRSALVEIDALVAVWLGMRRRCT